MNTDPKSMKEPTPDERRARLDAKIHAGLKHAVVAANTALQAYDSACPGCRMFNDGLVRQFAGGACVYDYGLKEDGPRLSCLVCNRVVWD